MARLIDRRRRRTARDRTLVASRWNPKTECRWLLILIPIASIVVESLPDSELGFHLLDADVGVAESDSLRVFGVDKRNQLSSCYHVVRRVVFINWTGTGELVLGDPRARENSSDERWHVSFNCC